MKPVRLRKANLGDLSTLQAWDEKEHVLASDPHDDWNWEFELGREPAWREQLMAEIEGKPLGFIQIIDPALEESHYWGEVDSNLRAIDIWIGEEENLGRGYGTQMMIQAIERCFVAPEVKGILIDPLESNTRALQFYERLGFQFLEKRRFGQDDCCVYFLTRAQWKARVP